MINTDDIQLQHATDLLRRERSLHNETHDELKRVTNEAEKDKQRIHGLMVDLKLYEMTIARLTVDETIRIEQELSDGQ